MSSCELVRAGNLPHTYVKVTSGTCADKGYTEPTSKAQCETAAKALQIANDKTASAYTWASSYYTSGCYYSSASSWASLYFFTMATGKCAAGRPCLCVAPPKAKCNHDTTRCCARHLLMTRHSVDTTLL